MKLSEGEKVVVIAIAVIIAIVIIYALANTGNSATGAAIANTPQPFSGSLGRGCGI